MKKFLKAFSIVLTSCMLISCGGGGEGSSTVSEGDPVIELIDYGSAARYPFDETTGSTAYNDYFDDFHGQIIGAQRVEGKAGNALDFSGGSGSHVLFDICCFADPNTGAGDKWVSFPDDSFTIAVWLKPTSMLANSIYPIFGGWYGSVQSMKLRINDEGLEFLLYPPNNGSPIALITSSSTLNNDEWVHVTITHDGSHSVVYLNGIENNSSNIVMAVEDIINDYFIGGIPTEQSAGPGEHSFPGVIDDFFISENVLSKEQIDALVAEGN